MRTVWYYNCKFRSKSLETFSPTIGVDPEIESVVLTVPYFSTLTATEASTGNNYVRFIYGGSGSFKLRL
jgi:hypothetical protein